MFVYTITASILLLGCFCFIQMMFIQVNEKINFIYCIFYASEVEFVVLIWVINFHLEVQYVRELGVIINAVYTLEESHSVLNYVTSRLH